MTNAENLPLSAFRPKPMVKLAEHHPQLFPIPAIDAHNHLGRWFTQGWAAPSVEGLIETMNACNIAGLVNLDGSWGDELEASLDRYDRAHHGRFATFARLDWTMTSDAGWGEKLAISLADSIRRGAKGLKLWKDLGLRLRDKNNELFFLDDPRLAPVWSVVADAGLPVLVHVADPVAFFRPLDATNERFEELLAHPDWHFHGPQFPSMERLLDSLEACVAANPTVNFIGAHVGCHAEDLGWVGRMLSAYPNFNVDISARIAELGRQPRAARRLVLKYPDRVLFGTDMFPPQTADYRRYLRFLSTDDEHFPYSETDPPGSGRWMISGIYLPDDVLAKVVAGNARRIIPAFAEPA